MTLVLLRPKEGSSPSFFLAKNNFPAFLNLTLPSQTHKFFLKTLKHSRPLSNPKEKIVKMVFELLKRKDSSKSVTDTNTSHIIISFNHTHISHIRTRNPHTKPNKIRDSSMLNTRLKDAEEELQVCAFISYDVLLFFFFRKFIYI